MGVPVGGSVVLARAGTRNLALVADADTKTLHVVDVDQGVELAKTKLSGAPSQLIVLPSGRVAVALRDRGVVELLDPGPSVVAPLVRSCEVSVPTEPVALGHAAGSLLVVSRWAAKLTALSLPSGEGGWGRRAELALARDPSALAVTSDRVVVLHATRGVIDDLPLSALAAERAEPRSRVVDGRVPAEKLRPTLRGAALDDLFPRVARQSPPVPAPTRLVGTQGFGLTASPDGTVYAALALASPSPPASSSSSGGYGGGTSSMSGTMVGEIAVLEATGELRGSPFFSGSGGPSDCLLPRAAAYDARRSLVLVACAGLDVVIGYDSRPPRFTAPRKDLRTTPLPGERRTPRQAERFRAKVGSGPSGIAVDEVRGRAWAWGAFDGTLTELALEDRRPVRKGNPAVGGDALVDVSRRLRTLKLRTEPALSGAVERGRALFHASDPARLAAADGRSCAS